MRSIERRFKKIKKEKPYWSDYACFAKAVEGRGFSDVSIRRNFWKLVPEGDYGDGEAQETIKYLAALSKKA